jgi:hypothetical protein
MLLVSDESGHRNKSQLREVLNVTSTGLLAKLTRMALRGVAALVLPLAFGRLLQDRLSSFNLR